jgi:hypothetical protein
MSKFVVDVEATGPCPGLYSMISFGVVMFNDPTKTFYSDMMAPIPGSSYVDGAMKVTNTDWDDMRHNGRNIHLVMQEFADWIKANNDGNRPMFFSDNNGFDWQFMNYYFWWALGENPFGHSSTNINNLYKGMCKDMRKNIGRLRKTKHTHHPVDDAMGNVEALIKMKERGLNL